jgi:predicted CXXCH cytochrome family protein
MGIPRFTERRQAATLSELTGDECVGEKLTPLPNNAADAPKWCEKFRFMKDGTEPDAKQRSKRMAPLALLLIFLVVLISCVTVDRVVMMPPEIPGAEFVGSKTCADCHGQITKNFPTATHAKLKAHGSNAENVGCESCHGPGSKHSESGGARNTIINPNKSPDVCFQCHLEMRGKFNLPHSHPVLQGKVTCSDCHDPHKGDAIKGGRFSLASEIDTCTKCHIAQRGPFVFEHEAVREGCVTCHDPHGTINEKMLVQRNSNLCLKCHFQQQTAAGALYIGGSDHTSRLSRGTCWSAGCHEAVHGSQIGSSLRF